MSAFLSSTRQSARVKKKYWNQFAFAVGGSTTIRDSKRKRLKNSDRQASRKLFNWHTFKYILSFLIFTPKIRRKPVRQKKLINWTLSFTKMAIIICGNKRYFSNCLFLVRSSLRPLHTGVNSIAKFKWQRNKFFLFYPETLWTETLSIRKGSGRTSHSQKGDFFWHILCCPTPG